MNNQDYLNFLKTPIQQAITNRVVERKTPTPTEILIKHPENNCGIHLREDGCLELFSNSGYLLIDDSGNIYLNGNQLSVLGSNINFDLSDPNSFNIQNEALNKKDMDSNQFLSLSKDVYIYYSSNPKPVTDINQLEKCKLSEFFNQISLFNSSNMWENFYEQL